MPFSVISNNWRASLGWGVFALVWLTHAPGAMGQATGRLNDTGLTTCADAASNAVTCGDSSGDSFGFPWQDGQLGRSPKDGAGLTKTGASNATSKGFDYTTVSGCTKDNVTGLVWEAKGTSGTTGLAGAQNNNNTYNWKNSNAASNGGIVGNTGTASGTTCYSTVCDTEAYVTYIRTQTVCGGVSTAWRLPTVGELMSLVDASKQATGVETADATYFPNLQPGRYWTSDNVPGNPQMARTVHFGLGSNGVAPKAALSYVILVRPGP